MNKGLKKLVAGVMTVASLAISVWGSGASVKTIAEGNDLIVKSAVNTVKIMQEEDISSLPEASVHIEAAKGETDGAQIVFRSDADILAYEITVSDLTAPNKKTIPATFCHIFSALFGYTVRNLGSMSYKQVEQGLLYYDAINGGRVVLFFAAN